MAVVLFVAVAPFLFVWAQGGQTSLSAYWETPMQPMFILANAATSFFFYDIPRWRLSAFALMLVTAFNIEDFRVLHNAFAGVFFIMSAYALLRSNRYRGMIWPYLASLAVIISGYVYSGYILVGEIFAIATLSVYHGLSLRLAYRLGVKRRAMHMELHESLV
jgi:hypothetical protein